MQLMPLDRAAAEGIAFSHLTLLVIYGLGVVLTYDYCRYLDVTAPPSPDMLHQLSTLADEDDAKQLEELANVRGYRYL